MYKCKLFLYILLVLIENMQSFSIKTFLVLSVLIWTSHGFVNYFRRGRYIISSIFDDSILQALDPLKARSLYIYKKAANYTLLNSNDVITVEPNTSFIEIHASFPMEALDQPMFKGLEEITEVVLKKNSIKEIKEGTFQEMKKLAFIDLSFNNLNSVTKKTFEGLFTEDEYNGIDLSSNEISQLEADIFEDLKFLRFLFLRNNKFTEISPEIYKNELWVQVDLSNNLIQEVDYSKVKGAIVLNENKVEKIADLNKDITSVSMNNNELTEIPGLTDIEIGLLILSLNNNKISTVDINAFRGLVNLTILDLHNNSLKIIPEGLFMDLRSLSALILSSNSIEKMDPKLSDDLPKVCIMDLSNNYLQASDFALKKGNRFSKYIRKRFKLSGGNCLRMSHNNITVLKFPKQCAVFDLDFSYNNIVKIPTGYFSSYLTLFNLTLSYNNIKTLDKNTFTGTEPINYVHLDHNKLTQVENWFSRLRQLRILVLSHNKIETIAQDAFAGIPSLREIDLSGNLIKEMYYGKYMDPFLIRCNVSGNLISTLNYDKLSGYIDFSNNNLTEVGQFMDDIRGISFKHNSIEKLKANIFEDAVRTGYLNVAYNKISTIEDNAFASCNLKKLYLNNNNIKILSKTTLQHLKVLQKLDLRSNEISTIEDGAFNDLVKLQHLHLAGNSLTEAKKTMWSGLKALLDLNLGQNKIEQLQEDTFQELATLNILILTGNALTTVNFKMFLPATYTVLDSNSLSSLEVPASSSEAKRIYMDLGETTLSNIEETVKTLEDKNASVCYKEVYNTDNCMRLLQAVSRYDKVWKSDGFD